MITLAAVIYICPNLGVGAFGNHGVDPFGSVSTNTNTSTGNTTVTGSFGGGVGIAAGTQACVSRELKGTEGLNINQFPQAHMEQGIDCLNLLNQIL